MGKATLPFLWPESQTKRSLRDSVTSSTPCKNLMSNISMPKLFLQL